MSLHTNSIGTHRSTRRIVSDGFGIDIASERADELDSACSEFVAVRLAKSNEPVRVIDLGSGMFGQTRRLASLGAVVIAIDMNEKLTKVYQSLNDSNPDWQIHFICADVATLDIDGLGVSPDAIYSQRMLHYLPYWRTRDVLLSFRRILADSGRLFLSVSGLESELSTGYQHASQPVAERYCLLSAEIAQTHRMTRAVCLYTLSDFEELLESVGLGVIQIWKSHFGNIKAICNNVCVQQGQS